MGPPLWCLDCRVVATPDCVDFHHLMSIKGALRQEVQQLQLDVPQVHLDVQCHLQDLVDFGEAQQILAGLRLVGGRGATLDVILSPEDGGEPAACRVRMGPTGKEVSLTDKVLKVLVLLLVKAGLIHVPPSEQPCPDEDVIEMDTDGVQTAVEVVFDRDGKPLGILQETDDAEVPVDTLTATELQPVPVDVFLVLDAKAASEMSFLQRPSRRDEVLPGQESELSSEYEVPEEELLFGCEEEESGYAEELASCEGFGEDDPGDEGDEQVASGESVEVADGEASEDLLMKSSGSTAKKVSHYAAVEGGGPPLLGGSSSRPAEIYSGGASQDGGAGFQSHRGEFRLCAGDILQLLPGGAPGGVQACLERSAAVYYRTTSTSSTLSSGQREQLAYGHYCYLPGDVQLFAESLVTTTTTTSSSSSSCAGQQLQLQFPGNNVQTAVLRDVPSPSPSPTGSEAEGLPIDSLDVDDLSEKPAGEALDEKATVLEQVGRFGVRRLTYVQCKRDPAWSLRLLERAAPRLEELELVCGRAEHLAALAAMPRLQRLQLVADSATLPPPSEPVSPRAGLRWLQAWGLPRATMQAVLAAHGASLECLQLYAGTPRSTTTKSLARSPPDGALVPPVSGRVAADAADDTPGGSTPFVSTSAHDGTPSDRLPDVPATAAPSWMDVGDGEPGGEEEDAAGVANVPDDDGGAWPLTCPDLEAVLARCGLVSLRRLVLRRFCCGHEPRRCREQLDAVRSALRPGVAVLCDLCDRAPEEDF